MTPDAKAELQNYRAHRFGITRLESGEYVLFDPSGEVIDIGPLSKLKPLILTGPEHYDTCVDNWSIRTRHVEVSGGRQLLTQLGLGLGEPTQPITRRF